MYTCTSVLKQLIKSERGGRYLWEYRYLNFFLARHTQQVFDWFINCVNPPTYEMFGHYWMYLIPDEKERALVLRVLERHHLIQLKGGDILEVTPKGTEYYEWRGILPTDKRSK